MKDVSKVFVDFIKKSLLSLKMIEILLFVGWLTCLTTVTGETGRFEDVDGHAYKIHIIMQIWLILIGYCLGMYYLIINTKNKYRLLISFIAVTYLTVFFLLFSVAIGSILAPWAYLELPLYIVAFKMTAIILPLLVVISILITKVINKIKPQT